MKLYDALSKLKPGQVVKARGDSFSRGCDFYGLDEKGNYYLSHGGSAGYTFKNIQEATDGSTLTFFAIYSKPTDYSEIEY